MAVFIPSPEKKNQNLMVQISNKSKRKNRCWFINIFSCHGVVQLGGQVQGSPGSVLSRLRLVSLFYSAAACTFLSVESMYWSDLSGER